MRPFRLAVLTLSLLPMLALAAPPNAPSGDELARMEKRARMTRVVALAEELELTEAQALKMADTMRQFDERRRPLVQQVRESAQVLRRAAQGEASALSQVDAAVQKIFDARVQLGALSREMYQALAKDLSPQKRAQLAIFMARHEGRKGQKASDADDRADAWQQDGTKTRDGQ